MSQVRLIQELKVSVITRDLKNPESFKEKEINYGNKHDREWLAKHCFWAMTNSHSVVTAPISDITYTN